jgi:hypothetical protein
VEEPQLRDRAEFGHGSEVVGDQAGAGRLGACAAGVRGIGSRLDHDGIDRQVPVPPSSVGTFGRAM